MRDSNSRTLALQSRSRITKTNVIFTVPLKLPYTIIDEIKILNLTLILWIFKIFVYWMQFFCIAWLLFLDCGSTEMFLSLSLKEIGRLEYCIAAAMSIVLVISMNINFKVCKFGMVTKLLTLKASQKNWTSVSQTFLYRFVSKALNIALEKRNLTFLLIPN